MICNQNENSLCDVQDVISISIIYPLRACIYADIFTKFASQDVIYIHRIQYS